jgi:hypothetical protein
MSLRGPRWWWGLGRFLVWPRAIFQRRPKMTPLPCSRCFCQSSEPSAESSKRCEVWHGDARKARRRDEMGGMSLTQPRKQLTEISSFGAIDADADSLLRACFQDHDAYVSARDMQKFLVLGRKGSGKTAIYKKLITEKSSQIFSIGHTFDDYPWNHHDLQAEVGVPEERRYIHSWKYLILIGLAKILLNSDNSQPWSDDSADALGALEDFVVDSYGSRDPDFRQLFSPEKELRFKGALKLKLVEIQAEKVRVRDLPIHIQAVNAAMQDCILRALNPDCRYYICFDQLDLGFSVTDATYAQRLTGLLIAAKDLFVASRDASKSLNPVVFLRDDIYQDLQFEDKNKITENYMSRVLWSEDESDGLTLRKLMERRFSQTLNPDSPSAVTWDEVFDESKQMPSRQSKYRHICDRTFLRPRDMIKFCNEILAAHTANPDADLFENSAIHAARDNYSNYLLNELDDEIAKHVPKYRDFLEVLKALGAEKFTFAQFNEVFAHREELSGLKPMEALAELFEFSVISYLKPGGRSGGSEYVWRYKDPRARFDTTIEAFRVHPGFKEALDLIR